MIGNPFSSMGWAPAKGGEKAKKKKDRDTDRQAEKMLPSSINIQCQQEHDDKVNSTFF